jgi:hypothetical protein
VAIRDNITRGKVLQFLRNIFPQGTDVMTVVAVLYDWHPPKDVLDALEYLTSKGYITKREVPHPARKLAKLTTYTINAHGIDLCDGTTSDAGITIIAEVLDGQAF